MANPLVFSVSGVAALVAAAAQHGMTSQQGQQSEQMAEATLPDSLPQAELEPTERQYVPPLAATQDRLPGLPAASAAAQEEGAASAEMFKCGCPAVEAACAERVQRQSLLGAAIEEHPPCELGCCSRCLPDCGLTAGNTCQPQAMFLGNVPVLSCHAFHG